MKKLFSSFTVLIVMTATLAGGQQAASAAGCPPSDPYVKMVIVPAGGSATRYFDFDRGKAVRAYSSRPLPLNRWESTTFDTYFYTSAGRWNPRSFRSRQTQVKLSTYSSFDRKFILTRGCD